MPITTSDNDIKERLSFAYLCAVAARAGCQVATWAIDKESVDATVRPVSGSRSMVEVQMKATSDQVLFGNEVKFNLPIKNYNDMREVQTNPHYLVVLHLPGPLSGWLAMSPEQLAIKDKHWIRVVGDLVIHPTGRAELLSPRDLAVIDPDTIDEQGLSL